MDLNFSYLKFALVILPIFCLASPVMAQEQIRGEILEFGIYQFVGEQATISAPETAAGKATSSNATFVKTTDQIPLVKGLTFGFKWSATGFPEKDSIELVHILEHPLLKLPNGGYSSISRESYQYKPVNSSITHTEGYTFTYDYELIEGQYKFSVLYNNTPFITKTFTVSKKSSP